MLIFHFAACALLALQDPAPSSKQAAENPAPLFSRIAVIGASASAGFNLHVTLADALDAQIAVAHKTPMNLAYEGMFIDPMNSGEEFVEKAKVVSPTLVIAADFVFWFGYGEAGSEDERLVNLDLGLELFDELKCPLVVSRFPDMTPAVGKMLMSSQVPKPETLVKLNARLEDWAKKRGRVAFVALPEMLVKLRANETLSVGGVEFKAPASKARLMQDDDLHPTAEGMGVLARLCLDAACSPSIGAKPAELRSELGPILESLRKLEESRAKESSGGIKVEPVPPKPSGNRSFTLSR